MTASPSLESTICEMRCTCYSRRRWCHGGGVWVEGGKVRDGGKICFLVFHLGRVPFSQYQSQTQTYRLVPGGRAAAGLLGLLALLLLLVPHDVPKMTGFGLVWWVVGWVDGDGCGCLHSAG